MFEVSRRRSNSRSCLDLLQYYVWIFLRLDYLLIVAKFLSNLKITGLLFYYLCFKLLTAIYIYFKCSYYLIP